MEAEIELENIGSYSNSDHDEYSDDEPQYNDTTPLIHNGKSNDANVYLFDEFYCECMSSAPDSKNDNNVCIQTDNLKMLCVMITGIFLLLSLCFAIIMSTFFMTLIVWKFVIMGIVESFNIQ